MANQGLAEEFSHLSVGDVQRHPAPKLPPALQPRQRIEHLQNPVASHNSHPQTYRAVPAIYRPSLRNDEELPPPPVMHSMTTRYTDDNFPPPPPLLPPPPPTASDLSHATFYTNRNDAYNLPPPPPPVEHDYSAVSHTTAATAMATPTVYNPQPPPPSSYPPGQPTYSSVSSSYNSRSVSVTAPSSTPSHYPRRELNQPNYINHSDLPPPPPGPSQTVVPNYSNVHSANITDSIGGVGSPQPLSYKTSGLGSPQQHKYPGYSDTVNPIHSTASSQAGSYSTNSLPRSDGRKVAKEAEVDALTSLLMQNIESAGDPDFFGMCSKCGHRVVGQSNGCTAMDQVFHIDCFICDSCGTILRGKSFYAIETKPYCESCYVNTLEKCSVCSKPVIDRLLRATGKPYHPSCFTCVVCGKSLDGVPFTVDATNQIHCIDDFHKKFAPRCCVCQLPIMPDPGKEETVRVVAMDRSFHVHCYCCEDCGMLLSSEAEGRGCYPLDDHILCKICNAKRIQALTTKMTTEL